MRIKEQNDIRKGNAKLNLIAAQRNLPDRYEKDVIERLTSGIRNNQRIVDQTAISSSMAPRDVLTGQKLFEPQINPTSEKLASRSRDPNQPIEEILHARGQEYQQRAKLRQDKYEQYSYKQRESSKINHISEKIVREKEYFFGETSQDRLFRPIGEVKSSVLQTIDKPSFKPKINKKSEEIVQQSFGHIYSTRPGAIESQSNGNISIQPENVFYAENGGVASSSIVYDIDRELDLRYEESEDYPPAEIVDDTTSYYELDDGVYTLAPHSHHNHSPGSSFYSTDDLQSLSSLNDPVTAVHLRSEAWKRERERRLERERLARLKEIDKECSFQPKLKENKAFVTSIPKSELRYSNAREIADRQIEWLKKKEERLERERKKKEDSELDGYTFQPQISSKLPSTYNVSEAATSKSKVKPNSASSKGAATAKATTITAFDNRLDDLMRLMESEEYIPSQLQPVQSQPPPPPPVAAAVVQPPKGSTETGSRIPIAQVLKSSAASKSAPEIEDRIALMLNGWDDDPSTPRKISIPNSTSLSSNPRQVLRSYEMDAL
jgi:hypothetical protein